MELLFFFTHMQQVEGLEKSVMKETSVRQNHTFRLKVSFQNSFMFWCDLVVPYVCTSSKAGHTHSIL